MRTRARADGDDWVLNGQKCWITNAGVSKLLHRARRHRSGRAARNGISAFVVQKTTPGFTFGEQGAQARHQGLARPPNCSSTTAASPATASSASRAGLQDRAGHPRPHPIDDRRAGRRHRAGRPRRGPRIRQGTQAVRQAGRRLPGRAVHARRHGDEARGGPADGLRRGRAKPSAATPT